MATERGMAVRMRSPAVQASIGSYRATDQTRSRTWRGPMGGSGDRHADERTRYLAREITRSLERNAHEYAVFMSRWLDDLGTPWPRPTTSSKDWNSRIAARFRQRAMAVRGGFDGRQMSNWAQMTRFWFSHVGHDGDVVSLRSADGRCHTIVADRLAGGPQSNQYQQTIGGITLGPNGEPLKYWICPAKANGFPDRGAAVPYLPQTLEHIAHRTRQDLTRGLPPLISALDDIERIDSLLESTVISSEQLSNIYGAIKRIRPELARNLGAPGPVTSGGRAAAVATAMNPSDQEPQYIENSRGALWMLYDDQEWQKIDQTQPNMNVNPFLIAVLRMVGMGLSYPYEVAFMDMNALSWSAGKTLISLARTGMTRWREQVFGPALTQTYLWWLAREISVDKTLANPEWDQVVWDWPQLPWPDPLKEEQRNSLAIKNRTDSPQRMLGPEWDDIYRENHLAEQLRDELSVERIVAVQQKCDVANDANPNLKLHWTHIVTLTGADSAPGAYVQAAGAADGAGSGGGGGSEKRSDGGGDAPTGDVEQETKASRVPVPKSESGSLTRQPPIASTGSP